jgi:hypothetical protein
MPACAERPAVLRRGEPPRVGGEQVKRPTSCHPDSPSRQGRHLSITRPLKYKIHLLAARPDTVWIDGTASRQQCTVPEGCKASISMWAAFPESTSASPERATASGTHSPTGPCRCCFRPVHLHRCAYSSVWQSFGWAAVGRTVTGRARVIAAHRDLAPVGAELSGLVKLLRCCAPSA